MKTRLLRRLFIWLCDHDIHGGRRVDMGFQVQCRRCARERWNGMGSPGASDARWW